MAIMETSIEGGFTEPVFAAQAAFTCLMNAFARPGTVEAFKEMPRPPAPMSRQAAAVALTLCDHDTPVWLDKVLAASAPLRQWLGFHTGAPLVDDPADAAFAFVAGVETMPALAAFAQGTDIYPDRSATLVLQLDALSGASSLTLRGPGIETEAAIAPHPLPFHFVRQWQENGGRFPRGVDLVLTAPEGVAALPRTTRIVPPASSMEV